MMKILITNDDGIYAPGIAKLANVAKDFGDVYIVAPEGQCSAMAHRISILKEITIREIDDFPVSVVKAFSIGGTPADCVKIAVQHIMKEKPDIVFSGINNGYNAGTDILYSGTVAAAMEAVVRGIPAIAFSTAAAIDAAANGITETASSISPVSDYRLVDEKLHDITNELIHKPAGTGKIWNVNFPGCSYADYKGILWNRTLSKDELYPDYYRVVRETESGRTVMLDGTRASNFKEGTDQHALLNGYISIGTITNMVIGE